MSEGECFLDRDLWETISEIGFAAIRAGAILTNLDLMPEPTRYRAALSALDELRGAVRDLGLIASRLPEAPGPTESYHSSVRALREELECLR